MNDAVPIKREAGFTPTNVEVTGLLIPKLLGAMIAWERSNGGGVQELITRDGTSFLSSDVIALVRAYQNLEGDVRSLRGTIAILGENNKQGRDTLRAYWAGRLEECREENIRLRSEGKS